MGQARGARRIRRLDPDRRRIQARAADGQPAGRLRSGRRPDPFAQREIRTHVVPQGRPVLGAHPGGIGRVSAGAGLAGMTADRRAILRDQFLGSLKESPALMGVLNVTPDSFSDGGRHFEPAAAVARAKTMVAEGAAIVDVGGESTRPGHTPVTEDEELRRIVPVLEALQREIDAPVSVDTSKAAVAREAARLGASVINDVWGFRRDPGMADAVAETASAVVVMHNRESVDAAIDILDDVER